MLHRHSLAVVGASGYSFAFKQASPFHPRFLPKSARGALCAVGIIRVWKVMKYPQIATIPSEAPAKQGTANGCPSKTHLKRPRLGELLEHAPAAIGFLSGPELRCSYVNELAVRVTGRRSADELLGTTIREGLPELEGSDIFEIVDEVARTGRPFCGR